MKKLIKKTPLILWALILSIIAFFIVKENLISSLNTEQIRLFSGLLTIIGLMFVAINLQKQWKNERIKTEYLNQPDFNITGLFGIKFIGSGPKLCKNHTQCTDDHWFDLIQKGNLAARKLNVALFHEEEIEKHFRIKARWITEERLGKNDTFQYKIPQFKIPFKYFEPTKTNSFLILMQYESEYSGIKYKRVYQLCASPEKKHGILIENDWKNRIYFYEQSLINTSDSESISIKNILINYWLNFIIWLKIKKDYSVDDWLIDL
ncbi:MAG: hypothetical protein JKX79_12965 [Labilibaculum sp.]|nr:hypothetical protein [Labilibaculum sp.]